MDRIEIKKIIEKIRKIPEPEPTETEKIPASEPRIHNRNNIESEFDTMNTEELMEQLRGYQDQFIENLDFRASEPELSISGTLQDELNSNYCILKGEGKFLGTVFRLLRKLFGINHILGKQEKFNGITTRSINRNIEINTRIASHIYTMRNQIYFLSLQTKIMSRLITELNKTADLLAKDNEHRSRRDEYISKLIPEINRLYEKLNTPAPENTETENR